MPSPQVRPLHLLMQDNSDVPSACSRLSGLIAFGIWRTQKQTNEAKMGSNLMRASVIVVGSKVDLCAAYARVSLAYFSCILRVAFHVTLG